MMKGMLVGGDENMSNITSASNEANSLSSSGNRNEIGTMYPPQPQPQSQSFASVVPTNNINQAQPTTSTKRKRNLPGNPDPEADVIALSPKSLMATNRFICEICNKGFQRDQNLQLHRRGHNLPWKLKQRSKTEVTRKKVYICPETACVHHDPSRALGDLTGIKKHFSRKHGEKKWKCEKCSKRYAVQSDWKAHSKICGTREYRCDCGTLFSRRDSFITHRAFCDALAEESARSSSSLIPPNHHPLHLQNLVFPLKVEQNDQQDPPNISFNLMRPPSSNTHDHHNLPPWLNPQNNPNPNSNPFFSSSSPSSSSSAHHMSATALLQKAAQMGVTMSKPSHTTASQSMFGAHMQAHMCAPPAGHSVLGLSSSDGQENLGGSLSHHHHQGFVNVTSSCMEQVGATALPPPPHLPHNNNNNNNSLFDHVDNMVRNSMSSTNHGFVDQGTTFEEALNGMLNSRRDQGQQREGSTGFQETFHPQAEALFSRTKEGGGGGRGGGGGGNEELTRDFLGLRGFPTDQSQHFLSMAGFDHINTSSPFHQQQNQAPWQG